MKFLAPLCLVLALLSLAAPEIATPQSAAAGTYAVDGVHSTVLFQVEHFGVSRAYGRFNQVSGQFTIGEEPSQSSVQITIQADSVDTGNEKRDNHLRGPDFLNVKQFPTLSFQSTKIAETKPGLYDVTGELTCRGVKKEITAKMERIGAREVGSRGFLAGFEAVFTIERTDFDMSYGVDNGALGDAVKVFVSLEGKQQ